MIKSICADLVLQRLAPSGGGMLNRQLYECLRGAILDGSLPPSSPLPASRDLAREIGMSRNTVLHAYEQLRTEGYVHARVGSGTFVAETAPDSYLSAERLLGLQGLESRQGQKEGPSEGPSEGHGQGPTQGHTQGHLQGPPQGHTQGHLQGHKMAGVQPATASAPVRLARRAQALLSNVSAAPAQWGAFMPGVPDVTQFPNRHFSRILSRLWRDPAPQLLTYAHGGGHPALRAAIAEHVRVARSVRCEPSQILVTEGVHQAIDLTLRMLVDPRETVWVEEPGYWGFHKVLQMVSAVVKPLHVEAEGSGWPAGKVPPRLIFVTPSHQYPLGLVMSLARRRELLEYARASGSWIVEDDYDSEFRYAGRPIPAMQGLEEDAPVIYIGTFSKTLFPGLRVGYMVLPRVLAEAFRSAHADLYREGHGLTQAALAELLEQGHYAAHIRRMRVLYARRRALLEGLINRYLGPEYLDPQSSNAGLHLVLRLPPDCDDVAITAAAQARGVLTRPLSRYYMHPGARRGLLLGYACVHERDIAPAFHTLRACLPR